MFSTAFPFAPTGSWLFEPSALLVEGVVGTLLMTLFMYGIGYFTKNRLKVVKILGTMLTFSTTSSGGLSDRPLAIGVGWVAHLSVGLLFTWCFHLLWEWGVGSPTLLHGLLFGLAFGLIGIMGWYAFFTVYPHPPDISLPPYLLTLLVAHVVFAFGVIFTHHWVHIVVIPVPPV